MPRFKNSQTVKAVHKYLSGATMSRAVGETHLSGSGAVKELEKKLREHFKMDYALCVSNATTGLFAVALALGLRDQEFVTTPYTYGASLAGWLLLGNRPVFADVDPQILTLECESVERIIGSRTKAILAADIFGNPSDTIGLRKIADKHGLFYIADAAQSLGGSRDDLPASSLADAIVVSFTVGKTVFAGEGGAILTNNSGLYEKLIWFTQHPLRQKFELGIRLDNEFAFNARIHPLSAVWANAVFDSSLKRLKSHQDECFRVIDALNSTGLTEEIGFRKKGIKPSFCKISASWKGRPQESALLSKLRDKEFNLRLESSPVRLLYQQPAFIAQYRRWVKKRYNCPKAEQQAESRFCIRLNQV